MTALVRKPLTTLFALAVALAAAGPALAGDGGLSPVSPNAPGAFGVTGERPPSPASAWPASASVAANAKRVVSDVRTGAVIL